MQRIHHRICCLLISPNVSFLSVHDRDVYSQIKEIKIHAVNQNKYKIKKQSWHRKSLSLFFQCCSWRGVKIKVCSFTVKYFFSFSFSWTCLMVTFKKTEYSPICQVFTEFLLITRIRHSTVNPFSSKREGNLLIIVVGSLTAWIGVITINGQAQPKFLF